MTPVAYVLGLFGIFVFSITFRYPQTQRIKSFLPRNGDGFYVLMDGKGIKGLSGDGGFLSRTSSGTAVDVVRTEENTVVPEDLRTGTTEENTVAPAGSLLPTKEVVSAKEELQLATTVSVGKVQTADSSKVEAAASADTRTIPPYTSALVTTSSPPTTTLAPTIIATSVAPASAPKPAPPPPPPAPVKELGPNDVQVLLSESSAAMRARCKKMHIIRPAPNAPLDPLTYVCLDGILKKKNAGQPCYALSIGIAHIWSFDDLMISHGCTVYAVDPSMGDSPSYTRHPKLHRFYPAGIAAEDGSGGGEPLPFQKLYSIPGK